MPENKQITKLGQIVELLRNDITAGSYTNMLPSMDELGKQYGTSRVTVRRALMALRDEGLVKIRQGSGTYVTNPAKSEASVGIKESVPVLGLPGTFGDALIRYLEFLGNPNVDRSIKARMIQIVDSNLSIVKDLSSKEMK
jgi:DNA-binding transcriptional MocR family regulator